MQRRSHHAPRRRLLLVPLACAGLMLVAVGCKQSTGAQAQDGHKKALLPAARKPYMGTERMQTDIRTLLARLETASPNERLEIQMRLARYGEPALQPLIDSLRSESTYVRQASAFSLGKIADPRALNPLSTLLTDEAEPVRFEAATAMLRMGDRRGLDTLLYGLEHEDPRIRARSILILEERTGERRGYRADATTEDRSAAVARWRGWAAQSNPAW